MDTDRWLDGAERCSAPSECDFGHLKPQNGLHCLLPAYIKLRKTTLK